jgi:GntR family transcriptional regulator, transcriptional repressor for pyruvate dehydrogenase complex
MEKITTPKEVVFKKIQDDIIHGKWKPKMKIPSENELSKELNVARVSVREAIEKMVALGILEKRHGKGTYIKQLDPSISFNSLVPSIILEINKDTAIEIQELRLSLDVGSAKLCAEKRDANDIKRLEEIYEKMAANIKDIDRFIYFDALFHRAIAEGTKNRIYKKLYDILYDLFEYHQKKIANREGLPIVALRMHKKILNAIIEKDEFSAAKYMEQHLITATKRVFKAKDL